ncbi:MAG: diacylglycerol kinase family protein [Croceibacterium sp.]
MICNASSGSNDEEAVGALCKRLAPDRVIPIPGEDVPSAAELDAADVQALAIFTGDGTANSVLLAAEGFGGVILVLPGGTTNLLARALHGEEATAEAIIDAFHAGAMGEVERDFIETSNGCAHSEVLAGPGAAWSDVRETLREGDIAGVARTTTEAIQQVTSGPQVHLAQPPRGRAEGYPAVLLTLDGRTMQVDGYGGEGIADFLAQGVALLKREFREGPHDALGRHRSITLRADEPIALMVDGERRTGGMEERIALRPARLRFLSLRTGGHG